MKNPIHNIYISPSEYSYIVDLTGIEKFKYLVELFDVKEKRDINLNEFFESIQSDLNDSENVYDIPSYNLEHETDAEDDAERVDVMIDDQHVLIESNSLKNIRVIVKNLFESGYILSRDHGVESMFKTNKVTRYLRVYKITGIVNMMCLN